VWGFECVCVCCVCQLFSALLCYVAQVASGGVTWQTGMLCDYDAATHERSNVHTLRRNIYIYTYMYEYIPP